MCCSDPACSSDPAWPWEEGCVQQLPGLAMAAAPLKVCIVGSGNWGSAVAKIIGSNVKNLQKFSSTVKMWVFEETVNGRKLTDIINNDHENVKYLPGHKLPENVVAVPNLSEAVQDADLLVFVIPHQFIHKICDEITGRVPKKAVGITLIKGIDEGPDGLKLISDIIREKMGIDISVLMGANIASEVAAEKFCETTIGSKVLQNGLLFKELLQTPNFRITVVDDADTVELCGALKVSHPGEEVLRLDQCEQSDIGEWTLFQLAGALVICVCAHSGVCVCAEVRGPSTACALDFHFV